MFIARFIKFLFLILIAIAIIAVTFVNKQEVPFNFNPFDTTGSSTVSLPFFTYLFAALFLGLILGGLATWWSQGKYRRLVNKQRYEIKEWRRESKRLTKNTNLIADH